MKRRVAPQRLRILDAPVRSDGEAMSTRWVVAVNGITDKHHIGALKCKATLTGLLSV